MNKYDTEHLRNLGLSQRQVAAIYESAAKEAAAIGVSISDFNPDRPFSFDDYPQTKARIEKIIKGFRENVEAVVVNGARSGWTLANNKNSALCDLVFGDNKYRLTKEQERKYYSNNGKALEAFLKRKTGGLNLSDRVWNYSSQFKSEIETGLDWGIRQGLPAGEMARELKQYLREPDRFYRRFLFKAGEDEEGKALYGRKWKRRVFDEAAGKYRFEDVDINDYHPGRGVYRSSYGNAMRLARTETNMAYRTADHERWQQLDFVVGIEVHLSNNHTLNGVPFRDICDDLQGKYPKEFKFTGWHPMCRCIAVSILKTEAELAADNEAVMRGEEPGGDSVNAVRDVPEGFRKWVKDNEERIAGAKMRGTLPYFLKDNFKDGNMSNGLIHALSAKPVKPVKTEEQKAEIQSRWNTRVTSRKYDVQLQEINAKYGKESEVISGLITKIRGEIQNGTDISRVDAMVEKLNRKVQIKAAWDERVEENRLGTLLVDVKKLKAQYDMPAIQSVFKAVESKLAGWENLSLSDQVKKLNFEIDWVEKNKKYDTWHAARDAYKKRLEKVKYLIAKQDVETSTAHALDFAKSTKSANVKELAMELKTLLNNNASIENLQQKALQLNSRVIDLEAAKAAREAKKTGNNAADWNNPDNYTKKRKDDAMWAKDSRDADRKVRGVLETVWQGATDHEKLSAYRYTAGSSYINEPLRGQSYIGQYLGKYDSKKDAAALTGIINKSSYNFDMWVQRGVGENGFKGLFGFDIEDINDFKSIYGKTGIEKGFSSCGTSKGTGFDNQKIIYNIYCPRGTKMLYAEPYSAYGKGSGKTWDGKAQQQNFGSESEIILQRSTKFRIVKAEYKNGRYYIDLEVIGQL
jgi:hypothetical protein